MFRSINFFSNYQKRVIKRLYETSGTVTLPDQIGEIRRFKHDKHKDENKKIYTQRCFNQVKEIIIANPDKYTFLCYSTVIGATLPEKERTPVINKILSKVFSEQSLSQQEHCHIQPGHIALFTSEGEFISHVSKSIEKRRIDKTQWAALQVDIENSIQEGQYTSTYVVTIAKYCFVHTDIKEIQKKIMPYQLGAVGNTDNCSTPLHGLLLTRLDDEIVDPIQTLQALVLEASLSKVTDSYTFFDQLLDIGLGRTLHEVARDEYSELCKIKQEKELTTDDTMSPST